MVEFGMLGNIHLVRKLAVIYLYERRRRRWYIVSFPRAADVEEYCCSSKYLSLREHGVLIKIENEWHGYVLVW